MDSMEPKRVLILRVLEVLQKYSGEDHPLKQSDIAAILERDYGLEVERKAIGRAAASLRDCGYDVESTHGGAYLRSRDFTDAELRMLIDGVLSSRYIPAGYSRDLINKLCGLTNIYFRSHVNHICSIGDWGKTDNRELFFNIELIDGAIEEGRQLRFDYNAYGADKKLRKTAGHRVSPYQLVLHNQRYYLMALEERWKNIAYYRLDRITGMETTDRPATDIRTLPGFENGVDYRELAGARPYMFNDRAVPVELLIDPAIMDAVVDWFRFDFCAAEAEDGKLRITLRASPAAMEYWALQYLNYVEVLSPAELREKITADVHRGAEKYPLPKDGSEQ